MMSSLMELRSPAFNTNENLATYAVAVCSLYYYRKLDPFLESGEVGAQGALWKKHYNTPLGAGTVPKYVF
jgi:hypothetical protein